MSSAGSVKGRHFSSRQRLSPVGYAGGYGVGAHVEWVLRMSGKAEYLIVTVALILIAVILARRVLSAFHN